VKSSYFNISNVFQYIINSGEFVIIGVASAILLWEYNRQNNKEYQKEAEEQAFVNNLEDRITELSFANEELDARLREMQRLIYATPSIMVCKISIGNETFVANIENFNDNFVLLGNTEQITRSR